MFFALMNTFMRDNMADTLSKEQRSYNMSRIRSKWTAPERKLHNLMKSYKIKHIMHPSIPGSPDVILKDKVAIFIDSCFFHKCPLCYKEPASNPDYWLPKIEKNVKRDQRNTKALEDSGWKVIRLWEHEIKNDIKSCINRIVKDADLQIGMKKDVKKRVNNSHTKPSKYFVIDICSGMGGLSLAAKNVGMKPIAAVDINPHALKTYKKNFPNVGTINGDVSDKNIWNLCVKMWQKKKKKGKRFAIVSGPPCQGFSVAGPRNPNDPRNDVLIHVAKAIAFIKPSIALIENVPAVLSPRNSARIKTFRRILSRAGYNVLAIKMDALNFGVPQRRLRAFFFITKNRLDRVLLERFLFAMYREKVTVGDALKGLPKPKLRPERCIDDDPSGIPNHFAMRHSEKVKRKIARIKPGGGPLSYRKLDFEKPSKTLISGHRAPPAHPYEPRSLTVREVARLQGFPDTFRIYGRFGTQMEQVTNAVPPSMGEAALSAILHLQGD